MMALSACSSLSHKEAPTVIEHTKIPSVPPPEYVTKCEKTLPEPSITRDAWMSLEPAQQWDYVKEEVGKEWASAYFTCAERHNTFVDWYNDDRTN